jgi:hypothetical protein
MSEEQFNPWTLPRPEIREDERDYTDARHPGLKVRIRFRELNPFTEGQALRLYGEYYERFIKPKSTGNGKEPTPQLLPTPTPVLLNELILDDLVLLQAMHVPQEGQKKYGLMEWSGFAVNMPTAYREMVRTCKELNREPEQDSGNVQTPENTASGESSNPLSSTTTLIPNGCSTSVDASGASHEHSEESPSGSESPLGNAERTQELSIPASSGTTSG